MYSSKGSRTGKATCPRVAKGQVNAGCDEFRSICKKSQTSRGPCNDGDLRINQKLSSKLQERIRMYPDICWNGRVMFSDICWNGGEIFAKNWFLEKFIFVENNFCRKQFLDTDTSTSTTQKMLCNIYDDISTSIMTN